MRCDVLAIGTELLLGQIIDSNSAWIGGELAAHGIDSLAQVKVGDNVDRIVVQLRRLLADADAVIVCGGLGPTHDDLTRAGDRRGDGCPARARRGDRRRDPGDVRRPRPDDDRQQPPPGRRSRRRDHHPPDPRHGPRPHLPGRRRRRRQGDLRRAGRAARDVRHGAAGGDPRPRRSQRRGRRSSPAVCCARGARARAA